MRISLTKTLPLSELRQMWAKAWGKQPHSRIGRTMLEKSLEFKISGRDVLTAEQQERLDILIKKYKRSPNDIESNRELKPGTRLVRIYKGQKHCVLVRSDSFEYAGKKYTSLSKIANNITGKNWNGWIFFGLKKVDCK